MRNFSESGTFIGRPAGPGQRGFTLAELAIVLVLIGLLSAATLVAGGILKQSRIKRVANDLEHLRAATLVYQDRYAALPGDDSRASSRWPGRAKDGLGNGRLSGTYAAPPPLGDPMTALTVDAADGGSLNFWWHLRLAEMVVAPPRSITPVAQPLNVYSGVLGVEWAPLGFPRLAACTANLPGDVAIGVENQLDDGQPRTGFIRTAKQNVDNEPLATANAAVTGFVDGDADFYILCRRFD